MYALAKTVLSPQKSVLSHWMLSSTAGGAPTGSGLAGLNVPAAASRGA